MRSTFLISHLISHLWDLLCILKYMFCFFKLTSKIVRATKDILSKGWAGHSPTAVCRALALRKQKDFYSNIWYKIKRKKNLKNAVVTHNFYIDLHLMFPKCLALIRVLCCFWTQPFYKNFQQAAVLSVQQPSQPLGYGTFVFQMRKVSEDLHRARDVAISELSESSSISEETHRNSSVEQSWCRALWYGTVTLTRARQRLCWAPLSRELFLKCHKCFWEVINTRVVGHQEWLGRHEVTFKILLWVCRGDCLCLMSSAKSLILRRIKSVHFIANIGLYYPTTWRLFFPKYTDLTACSKQAFI